MYLRKGYRGGSASPTLPPLLPAGRMISRRFGLDEVGIDDMKIKWEKWRQRNRSYQRMPRAGRGSFRRVKRLQIRFLAPKSTYSKINYKRTAVRAVGQPFFTSEPKNVSDITPKYTY